MAVVELVEVVRAVGDVGVGDGPWAMPREGEGRGELFGVQSEYSSGHASASARQMSSDQIRSTSMRAKMTRTCSRNAAAGASGITCHIWAQGYGRRVRLMDRRAEKQALHQLLDSVRAGMSGALVLRGSPEQGSRRCSTTRSSVRRTCRSSGRSRSSRRWPWALPPFTSCSSPSCTAWTGCPGRSGGQLGVAFGLESGPPADLFLVGLAVLMLLSDTARVRPVVCVIDDAQWLDDESADVLGFVARRLLADRVGMLFAIRETTEPDPHLQVLPGLRLAGLPKQDAYELLETSINRPIDAGVAERIVVETGGNPLAIVVAAAELTPEQLGGREPLPEPLPVGHQLEDLFVRRARELPAGTQTLLLLAAAEQPGRGDRLWQAAAALGIPESAAMPAEATGMVAFWPEVRFSHPLVRSAVYHAAVPGQRREAHRALAAHCDPQLDVVPRAWHLAAAAAGPDEGVAAQLAAAADRARSRGGYAATAALLERAALLTPDEERRAKRRLSAADAHVLAGAVDRAEALLAEAATGLHDPLSAAQATRLEGRIRFHRGQVAEAASALVRAARRMAAARPARREGRAALRTGGHGVRRVGAQRPPPAARSRRWRGICHRRATRRTRPPTCCSRVTPHG